MRFMEETVAENIRKQNSIKAQNENWLKPENQIFGNSNNFRHSTGSASAASDFRNNFDFGFPFGDAQASTMLANTNNNFKRIKLQHKAFDFNNQMPFSNGFGNVSQNGYGGAGSDSNGQSYVGDDDDDYDEDNVPEDHEDGGMSLDRVKNEFTIEVFDDEEEERMAQQQREQEEDQKPFDMFAADICKVDTNSSKDTEKDARDLEMDADKMFLLSLVPYLKNVSDNRKLLVRQKLQSVLIDELG